MYLIGRQVSNDLLLQSTLDVLLALAQGLLSDAELRAMGGAEGRGLLADALVGRLNREPNDTALDVQVSLDNTPKEINSDIKLKNISMTLKNSD